MLLEVGGNCSALRGEIFCPGDKSISHRSIILLSIAKGQARVRNVLNCEDVRNTIKIFKDLGVKIKGNGEIFIEGVGLEGLNKPKNHLYCGNSGTTMRLLSGLLSGQGFTSILTGDNSLSKRPMDRIINPLLSLGANISGREGLYAPLRIEGGAKFPDFDYSMDIASAQIKSCLLLAGLYSDKSFTIYEKYLSRDHTERMLKYLNVDISYGNLRIDLGRNRQPISKDILVPGDISSASFFIVAALIIEGSEILIRNVGLNKTRTGILNVMLKMGGNITIENKKVVNNEPIGNLRVKYSKLRPIIIKKEDIGTMIDEIPIIAVAAAFAQGNSYIYGLDELKYKETNRLEAIISEFKRANIVVDKIKDGIMINGNSNIRCSNFNSYKDHRMAMALTILALKGSGKSYIRDYDCINISYPDFYKDLKVLKK